MPVETLTDSSLVHVFSDGSNIDPGTVKGIKEFLHRILTTVIQYSSKEQKEVLVDWICFNFLVHHSLRITPLQKCKESRSLSSLCFINQLFVTATANGHDYLMQKVHSSNGNYFIYTVLLLIRLRHSVI